MSDDPEDIFSTAARERDLEPTGFGEAFVRAEHDSAVNLAGMLELTMFNAQTLNSKIKELEKRLDLLDEKLDNVIKVFSAFLKRAPLIEEDVEAHGQRLLTVEERLDSALGS